MAYLKTINVENFRNHKKTIVHFDKNITVLVGKNGAGKTSLIEAVYALAILKPYRSIKKNVFIKEKENYAKIEAELLLNIDNKNTAVTENLEIFWEAFPQNRSVFRRNNANISTADFLQKKSFLAVLFAPEDLNLPFDSSRERRKFLSRAISSISHEFFFAAVALEKILKQRNTLLKDYSQGRAQKKEFNYWDEEFIKNSQLITKERGRFIDFINLRICKYYHEISGNKDNLEIVFMPSSEDIKTDLPKYFYKDSKIGTTSIGAHRDDFILKLRNKPITENGSRGEVRSSILALKLAKRDFLESQKNITPIMLFDDVLSELDENHRQRFFEIIKNHQSITTTTDVFKNDITKIASTIYEIEDGKIMN